MRITTFFTTASLALLSTVLLAQSVTFDFDRAANFASFRTYAWTRGNTLPDALNHQRIVRAVDAQLTVEGHGQGRGGRKPDVLVAYHASFDRDLQINAFGIGWGVRFGGAVPAPRASRRSSSARWPSTSSTRTAADHRVARHGHQGHRPERQARQARQEHRQGGGEAVPELPAKALTIRASTPVFRGRQTSCTSKTEQS